VNLIALAAEQAGEDARAMAAAIPDLTAGGGSCATFDQCSSALAAGRIVDYEGPDGRIDIDADGNRSVATFSAFRFDSTGVDEHVDEVVIPG
jgi:branched-chain amino acid transport system substrate-binding protein